MSDDIPSPALLAARAAAATSADLPMSSRMLDGFGLPASDGSVLPAGTPPVKLNVMFESKGPGARFPAINMSLGMDVASLKKQLFVGAPHIPPESQQLSLLHFDGSIAAELHDDRALLGSFSPLNGWCIHVHDGDTALSTTRATEIAAGDPDTSWAIEVKE